MKKHKKTERIVITVLTFCLIFATLFIVFSMIFPQKVHKKGSVSDPISEGGDPTRRFGRSDSPDRL